mmetsp:Transcript_90219/g.140889  ORF Transcript_90219/g.140889 Transcript_90219/m.140889 type:complete len:198 (-) Transcript_90219:115-708(-)|eukprot:CAMPEP_0169222228 /NCGR_PEP_ID=MMETSP1016-20121227/21478_1 /TAXON_ID=342587 /ORGANISM="Karlodinium micrum, Strain CCMP2283" /LENGTH=197 /DNA_ID=CAMNT_0009300505 /DNA_START=48 /DNA_END=641 /DNA_ORIENTATION=+
MASTAFLKIPVSHADVSCKEVNTSSVLKIDESSLACLSAGMLTKDPSYTPGDFLRKAVAMPYTVAQIDYDNASEVSTSCPENSFSLSNFLSESLHNDDAPAESEIGSAPANACLSEGSAGHGSGNCKPCGFFHKGGCQRGLECKFCHLCPAGSIEQNRKAKRKIVRIAHRMKMANEEASKDSVQVTPTCDKVCRMTF